MVAGLVKNTQSSFKVTHRLTVRVENVREELEEDRIYRQDEDRFPNPIPCSEVLQ